MESEPLFDLRGRTVAVNPHVPLANTLDSLLRLHADLRRWREPITLYLGLHTDFHQPLPALDTLMICGVIASLRSRVVTVGLGLLTGHEALVLASGSERFLLPQALVCVGGADATHLPHGFPGLNPSDASLRTEACEQINREISSLIRQLGLAPDLWRKTQILSADKAIKLGLADQLVPAIPLNPIPHHAPPEH
jgi:hypothetical protein